MAGTAISKEASDVILLNDDFNSIVNAIKWGRHIYHTVLKYLQFQFTVSWVAVIVVVVGASIVGVRLLFSFFISFSCMTLSLLHSTSVNFPLDPLLYAISFSHKVDAFCNSAVNFQMHNYIIEKGP